jgi:hypothetical protein
VNDSETRACEIIAMGYEDDPVMKQKILDGTTRSGDVLRCVGAVSKFLDTAFPSTTNTAALPCKKCQRAMTGYCDSCVATLTHQQGGEQEADVERQAREFLAAQLPSGLAQTVRNGNSPYQWVSDALNAITAALRTKQPAASEGDDGDGVANCAECGAFLESVRPGKHQHPTCSQANTSKQAAGEDCENMIDPVQIKVSIPGQLGTTVRFVERSWLYPNN